MSERSVARHWRIGAVVLAGLLACGLPLWPIPYSQVSMPGNPSGTVAPPGEGRGSHGGPRPGGVG